MSRLETLNGVSWKAESGAGRYFIFLGDRYKFAGQSG